MKHTIYTLLTVVVTATAGQAQSVAALKNWLAQPVTQRPSLTTAAFQKPLSKREANDATTLLLTDQQRQQADQLRESWTNKAIAQGDHVLKFEYRIFGTKPADGRSLFISMHGGGNAPANVNDQQWKNQIGLYKPAEGVYIAPRAPTDTWNLWHEVHIDSLFDELIRAAVLAEGVNPDKVYVMGYSAGGDGVYQLAPRMADRWAAASMMAGHPNEVTPVNLRNIGFALHMGALDKAYERNKIAEHWSRLLDSLQTADPGGYKHQVQLHEGRSHWMQREDTVAVSWMMQFRRNPIPTKVVWKQDDVTHPDFYWLAVPADQAKTNREVIAAYAGNTIRIEKNDYDTLLIRLNDRMMNLDKPITVLYAGKPVFTGKVNRTLRILQKTIARRSDPGLVFPATIRLVRKADQAISVDAE
ncbi:hypothetical protein [Spirosoma lituiforme]